MASSQSHTKKVRAEDDEIIELGADMLTWNVHSGHNQASSLQPLFPAAYNTYDQLEQEQGQEQSQPRALLIHESLLYGVVDRTLDHGGVAATTNPFELVRPFPLPAD